MLLFAFRWVVCFAGYWLVWMLLMLTVYFRLVFLFVLICLVVCVVCGLLVLVFLVLGFDVCCGCWLFFGLCGLVCLSGRWFLLLLRVIVCMIVWFLIVCWVFFGFGLDNSVGCIRVFIVVLVLLDWLIVAGFCIGCLLDLLCSVVLFAFCLCFGVCYCGGLVSVEWLLLVLGGWFICLFDDSFVFTCCLLCL